MLNYANNLHKQLGNGGNNKAYENLLWQQQEVEVAKMKPNQLLILALSLSPPIKECWNAFQSHCSLSHSPTLSSLSSSSTIHSTIKSVFAVWMRRRFTFALPERSLFLVPHLSGHKRNDEGKWDANFLWRQKRIITKEQGGKRTTKTLLKYFFPKIKNRWRRTTGARMKGWQMSRQGTPTSTHSFSAFLLLTFSQWRCYFLKGLEHTEREKEVSIHRIIYKNCCS